MREIRPSGSMSGVWKRSTARNEAPALGESRRQQPLPVTVCRCARPRLYLNSIRGEAHSISPGRHTVQRNCIGKGQTRCVCFRLTLGDTANMTENNDSVRLTKLQRAILEALRAGGLITIDRFNMPWLGDRPLSPQTRYFLTEHRLIERRDKTRAVEIKSNGFVLSAKGLAVLQSLSGSSHPRENFRAGEALLDSVVERPSEPATERQLAYAKDLGVSVPPGASTDELSDLIDARLRHDKPAALHFQAFAKRHGVQFTQYTGKKSLFDRLFARLCTPGREEDMAAWFVFRVYRELVGGKPGVSIKDPDAEVVREIARQLVRDVSVVKSIRRYQGRDLVWFGEWTSPDGTLYSGGSNKTIAYKWASSLLREKVGSEVRGG